MSQSGITNAASSNPALPIQFTGDAGVAVPVANNLNIIGSAGVSTAGAGSTVTISLVHPGGIQWSEVTSATNPTIFDAGHGYIAKGAVAVVFLLPAAAAVGDEYWICGYGNLWTLTQNANQQVFLGAWGSTTSGVGGSVTATNIKDTLHLLCVKANLEFQVLSAVGNPLFA